MDVALPLLRRRRFCRAGLGGTRSGRRLPLPAQLCRRPLPRGLHGLTGRFRLPLADRFLEREGLPRNGGLFQPGRGAAPPREEGRAGAVVDDAAVLAAVLFEPADRAGDEGIIVGHRSTRLVLGSQASNGFCIRIVSSRSGLVDNSATGQPTSSSMRRTYLIACAGHCPPDRARAVLACHPSTVS